MKQIMVAFVLGLMTIAGAVSASHYMADASQVSACDDSAGCN